MYSRLLTATFFFLYNTAGTGIHLRVNDDGVDATHPDFASHFDVASSCAGLYLPIIPTEKNMHGTAVAGIAAASGTDGSCSVGVAPSVTLSSCHSSGEYFAAAPGGKDIDVTNNSYGSDACSQFKKFRDDDGERRELQATCPFSGTENNPCNNADCTGEDWGQAIETAACRSTVGVYCNENFGQDIQGCTDYLDLFIETCSYNTIDETSTLVTSITQGRGGKGTIHVFSSGNEFEIGEVVNFEGELNSRFTISVGATDKNAKHSSYSSSGVALFVSAPGGDSGRFTTNHITSKVGGTCYDAGEGTSYASPVVAGVAALILEANPNLGWRDVQGIFATTSQKSDSTDSSWVTNGVGLHHSTLYGFGIVDANAAVNAAKTWTNYSPERMVSVESGTIDLALADFPAPEVSSKITLTNSAGIVAENVVVFITLDHPSRGDFDITLTSPSGTKSLLVPGNRPEISEADNWKLLTVRAWGENPNGEWTLSFKDISQGDHKTCFDRKDNWYTDGTELYCSDLEKFNICANGGPGPNITSLGVSSLTELIDSHFETSAVENCCACDPNGGRQASDFPDLLSSWTLVVYGHDEVATTPPSVQVTDAPTDGAAPTQPPVQLTEAPTDGDEDESTLAPTEVATPPSFCFSGRSQVHVKDKGSIFMKDLQLQDHIMVDDGIFEPVYGFAHMDTNVNVHYLQLVTASSTLEISRNHLVFVVDNNEYSPASLVKVGDRLSTGLVTSVKTIVAQGAYAPLTPSGTIMVDNVKASSFVSFQESSTLMIGDVSTGLSYHWLSHKFETPQRVWCSVVKCEAEKYRADGIPARLTAPHLFVQWFVNQNAATMILVTVLFMSLLSVLAVLELVWMNANASAAVLLALFAAGRVFCARKRP